MTWHLGLEGAVEVGEEGVLPGQGQHPPLHQGALHVVVHQHHVLLQGLHGVVLARALQLGQEHLCGGPTCVTLCCGWVIMCRPTTDQPLMYRMVVVVGNLGWFSLLQTTSINVIFKMNSE